MGRVSLIARDQHRLGAYRAEPAGRPRGGVVVLQEIFGVNRHIRSVCDRLAAEGFAATAPALFDRYLRDFESGYSADEVAKARQIIPQLDWDALVRDTEAAVESLRDAGAVATMGFCMGGSVAFLSAARIAGVAGAICYYGGQIIRFADETARCPVQMHFGEKDDHIPLRDIETIREKQPDAEIYTYPDAGHGFHCDERASYHAESARLAWSRSLAFLDKAMR